MFMSHEARITMWTSRASDNVLIMMGPEEHRR
jgi:hypothetical protein